MPMKPSDIVERCARLVPGLCAIHGIQANSCILQAKVAILTLKHFRIDAEPIPCTVMIFNPPFAARLRADNMPKTAEEVRALEAVDGSYSVGIGWGKDRPGHWSGHLIVGSQKNKWVMDTSIGQASRPHHQINLGPILARMPKGFMRGDRHFIEKNGSLLEYRVTDNQRFRLGNDWTKPSNWQDLVELAVQAISREGSNL